MAGQKNATLRDVAERAGVSIATVSRVLNSTNYVSPKIKDTVRAAIKELGYYQNSIARSLKTNSTSTIGFVTADISNPYFITVAKAVEDLIRVKKYNLLVCSTEGDAQREKEYLQLLMSRNIDGLVLNGTGYNQEYIAEISTRIPVILIHRRYNLPENSGDLVDSDNEAGVYGLTKHLITFGHKNIFVIKGGANTSTSIERYMGFCSAMREIGIIVNEAYPLQYDGNFTMESGYRAVEHLCSLKERSTAILALNNTMALGALECLKAKNFYIPEDISVAAYNNIDYKELMTIRPTVHYIDSREIGLAVGEAILERLSRDGLPNREFIVKGHIVPGNAVSIPITD